MDAPLRTTVAGSLVTLLAATAGLLGARAGWHATVEERASGVRTSVAQRVQHHVAQQSGQLSNENILRTESRMLAGAAADERERAGPAARPLLDRAATAWGRSADRQDQLRSTASESQLVLAYRPAVVAAQEAESHAALSAEWTRREQADLGVAAMLAVALLLVSLSGIAPRERQRLVFLVAGGALTLHGAVRLVANNAATPRGTPAAAVSAYADAAVAHRRGDLPGRVAALRRAVAADPGYAAAWEALGNAHLARAATEPAAADAVKAYERAARTRSSPELLHDLGYAELLAGRTERAAAHLAAAVALLPDDLRAATTEAEVLVARGDHGGALAAAEVLVARFAAEPPSLRDALLAGWRGDRRDLRVANVGGELRDAFFDRLERAAATMEAYGTADPRPRGDTEVTDLGFGYSAGAYEATFAARVKNAHPADRVTVRLFRGTQPVAARTSPLAGDRATGVLAVDPGAYEVEVFVNGNLALRTTATLGTSG